MMMVWLALAGCSGSDGTPSDGGGGGGAPSAGSSGVGGAAGIGGAAGVGGTGGASGGDGSIPPTFDTFKQIVMQAPCFGARCHNDDQNPLNLRMDDQLYTRLTSRISENCGQLPIVNPGKPAESALIKILRGPCGPTARMPLGCVEDQDGACVPAEYIAALEQWIAAGAPP